MQWVALIVLSFAEIRWFVISTARPKLIHRISSKPPDIDQYCQVIGITSLKNSLFVAHCEQQHLTAYDTETFQLQWNIQLNLGDGGNVIGLTSCDTNNSLFVSEMGPESAVHKVDLSPGTRALKWRVEDWPCGMSVSNISNVLVVIRSLVSSPKIVEYTASGSKVRVINLPLDVTWPWQAKQLTNGQFAVCHGGLGSCHQVCIIDSRPSTHGNVHDVVSSFGNAQGSSGRHLNEPTSLAVDKNGDIFVIDSRNNRIVLLDPSLKKSCVLSVSVPFDAGLKEPKSLYLDEWHKRLYVGDNSGRVLVFEISH